MIAAYMTLDRIVATDSDNYRKALREAAALPLTRSQIFDVYLPKIIFGVMLIMVFVYFRAIAKLSDSHGARQVWFQQALVSAVVFVVWAYAMRGSVFTLNDLFVDKYAAMMVPFFTLMSGMFRPSATDETETPQVTSAQFAQPTAAGRDDAGEAVTWGTNLRAGRVRSAQVPKPGHKPQPRHETSTGQTAVTPSAAHTPISRYSAGPTPKPRLIPRQIPQT